MPVQTIYGPAYPNPNNIIIEPRALFAGARVVGFSSQIAVDATMSATSVLRVARVPTRSLFLPNACRIQHTAITSLTSLGIGLDPTPAKSGATILPVVLASALDVSAAGVKDMLAALTAVTAGQQAWQLAGLASDPGGLIDLIATITIAPTVAGTLLFTGLWLVDN